MIYQAERRLLSKVMTYGMPENCSVDLFLKILLNVRLPEMIKKIKLLLLLLKWFTQY